MIPSIQSKFFTRLLGGLALISMFLLLPHNAKATTFPGTGMINSLCTNININNVAGFGCKDINYTILTGLPGEPLQKTDLSGTSPGFLAAPVAPSGAFWIAPLSDVQFIPLGNIVSDWGTTFSAPANTTITVFGTIAVEGSVGIAVDGSGAFAGLESLTHLDNWSITVTTGAGTTHTLDFIFTGCISYPSCGGSAEPVAGLLVDPSWSLAAPGATLDTIPESVLLADAGVAPLSPTVPEPGSLLQLGTGLLGMVCAARRKWFG